MMAVVPCVQRHVTAVSWATVTVLRFKIHFNLFKEPHV